MKPLLIICILLLAFLLFWVILVPKTTPEYLPVQLPKLQRKFTQTSLPINEQNKKIRSISAKIKVEITGVRQDLWGDLVYEKDKKFRMIIKSAFGVELDVGSNDQVFWFWSKRAKPPTLYYCEHQKINTSRLKLPLNPLWLMGLLNINTVTGTPFIYEDKLVFGEPFNGLRKMTLVKDNVILGHYLYGDKLVASSENVDSSTIKMIWPDENIYMTWRLSEVKTNVRINADNWQMPNMKRKMDMSRI